MRLTSVLLSLLFISAPGVSQAEEVYKSIMPNGSIVYGESPQSGARKVEKIDARSAVNGAIVATPEDKQRARELNGASTAAVGVIPQAPRESPTASRKVRSARLDRCPSAAISRSSLTPAAPSGAPFFCPSRARL